MNNNNDDIIQQEFERDLEEINRNENKVNETLEKTNHNEIICLSRRNSKTRKI